MARTSTALDPDVTLGDCNLQLALESVYSTIVAALRDRGVIESREMYVREVPALVFETAVGAGWIPLADLSIPIGTGKGQAVWEADWHITDKTELPQWESEHIEKQKAKGWKPPARTQYTKYQVARLVQVGDLVVERVYMDSFYALLEDWISFYLEEVTEHDRHLKLLPKRTTAMQRQALLQDYIAKEAAEGIKTPMKKVAKDAGVQYTVLVAWKNKRAPVNFDSSDTAQRIMCLLLFGEHGKARHYRRGKA